MCKPALLMLVVAAAAAPLRAQASVATGSYVGTGNEFTISTTFQPAVVIVKGVAAVDAVIRTGTMGDSYRLNDSAKVSGITALSAQGFTISGGNSVNTVGVEYHWLALEAVAGEVAIGTYVGNNLANRSIAVGLRPDYVLVVGVTAQAEPVHRFAGMIGDASLLTDTPGIVTNRIQALEPTGFRIGNDSDVNQQNIAYHYVAVRSSARIAVGGYVGSGVSGEVIQAQLDPSFVLLQGETQKGVFRPDSVPASQDLTLPIENVASITGAITSFLPDGFTIGTDPHVNSAGVAYYWLTFGVPLQVDGGTDAGVGDDAGAEPDAGSEEDAGAQIDGGDGSDAGVARDAGSDANAGGPLDAGIASDGGTRDEPFTAYEVGCGCRSGQGAALAVLMLLTLLAPRAFGRHRNPPDA